MRKAPLVLWLLAVCLRLSAAVEPTRVELDLPKADAKATVSVVPVTQTLAVPTSLDPLALPAVQADLAPVPTAAIPNAPEANVTANAIGGGMQPLAEPIAGAQPQVGLEVGVEAAQVQFDFAKPASPDAAVVADAPGAAGVSLDEVVRRTASRKLSGVFIQQEQEGSLIAGDPRDSSGNVFRYYRPLEMRPALMAEVQDSLGKLGKLGYGIKRSMNFWDKDPYKVWNAWSVTAKLAYLGKLESAVIAEKGKDAAWSGKVSLILERAPGSPTFITKNPHMENPPKGYEETPGAHFLQPEIVSDKDSAAATINEALSRSRMIIAETGHAGTQYHVFLKAEPRVLAAQMASLQSALQLVNNALFAHAATESFQNVAHPSLLPWHAGRSKRVAELINDASVSPHTPRAEDEDSEKHAFVGLRYWGMEGGKAVVSFELRGASIPFKQRRQSGMVRGGDLESAPKPERDYAAAQYYLTFLSLYAEKLSLGRAPRLREPAIAFDAARADAMIAARARRRGMPSESYYGIEDFAKKLSNVSAIPPGYLFPFAASAPDSPQLAALMDEFLQQSGRMRAIERAGGDVSGERRNIEYMFWSAYAGWARDYSAQAGARFEALFRASAVD